MDQPKTARPKQRRFMRGCTRFAASRRSRQVSYGSSPPGLNTRRKSRQIPCTLTGMTKGTGCIFALVLMSLTLRAQQLTLDDAVTTALRQNVDVANTALDVSKAKDRIRAFRSLFFPKFSVYALG